MAALGHRLATSADVPEVAALMDLAIGASAALSQRRADRLEPAIMELDTQLVDDGTYFVVEAVDRVVGCGG